MAATASEDGDKLASDGPSTAAEEYKGDEGESSRGEEDHDDEFENSLEFDEFLDEFDEDEYENENEGESEDEKDGDEFDDEYDAADDNDIVGPGGLAANGGLGAAMRRTSATLDDHDGGGSGSDRLLRRTHSGIRTTSAASTGYPPLPHRSFAPPFYGRPPTPLPPSPSLTSLLRPSRPTTPDATDDELEPVPRAAPQVPTYEYYGFVLYLFSSLAFLIYLLWSYLPSPFLHALGIYYYPNRWWSLAIPSFLVMTLVYIYVALAAYNTEILTLPLDSIETIVDGAAKMAAVDADGNVVIVGGPDGTQILGRGETASLASKSSGANRPNSSRSHARHAHTHQQQQDSLYQTHSRLPAHILHNADSIASWSASKPFHHQREPSSPSPPLDKAAWRDWSFKSGRDRKTKKSASITDTGGAAGAIDDGGRAQVTDYSGLIMGGRRHGLAGRIDGLDGRSDLEQTGNLNSTAHRTPSGWNRLWNVGTDAVMDIPLAGVCEVLYG
ncbi:hypothetical protein SEPCBS119000_003104 [Sporothrix epigloea]|uniref:PIG-P domain-containing protein n=1 Tax=Sporothrix epigloea TaxID=1892477 RepID=A0ABP0DJS7_9PEZI